MVARIAPSPITTSVAGIGDALLHAPASAAFSAQNGGLFDSASKPGAKQVAANNSTNVPLPPSPPGEAFAAAVIAGQLPPRPITPEQLRQRLGSAWQPPASPLRLMDRNA
jgi:hypothetical protein